MFYSLDEQFETMTQKLINSSLKKLNTKNKKQIIIALELKNKCSSNKEYLLNKIKYVNAKFCCETCDRKVENCKEIEINEDNVCEDKTSTDNTFTIENTNKSGNNFCVKQFTYNLLNRKTSKYDYLIENYLLTNKYINKTDDKFETNEDFIHDVNCDIDFYNLLIVNAISLEKFINEIENKITNYYDLLKNISKNLFILYLIYYWLKSFFL